MAPLLLSGLEQQLLQFALAGEDPVLHGLREQLAVATCKNREFTGEGFITDVALPDSTPIVAGGATFVYDLNDIAAEIRDSIAAPGAYVREIIRTCKVTYTLTRRANGIDEIAYCTENAINPSGYFNRVPASYLESATESGGWSSSRVHANWTWTMFEKP